jgi:hypothetical protein
MFAPRPPKIPWYRELWYKIFGYPKIKVEFKRVVMPKIKGEFPKLDAGNLCDVQPMKPKM